MRKNTLVPENLLCDVYRLIYYLDDVPVPDYVKSLCDAIEAEIVDIIKRRELRAAYSAYKITPPGQLRETLRLDYIKLANINRSFVNKREIPYSSL